MSEDGSQSTGSQRKRSYSRFQRRSLRKIRANAKKRLTKFQGLRALNAESKKSLLRTVRHHEVQLAATDVYKDKVKSLFPVACYILGVTTVIIMFFFLSRLSPIDLKSLDAIAKSEVLPITMATWVVTIFVFILPAFMARIFSSRTVRFLPFKSFMLVWGAGGIIIFGAVLARLQVHPLSPRSTAIAAGVMGGLCFGLGSFGLLISFFGIENWLDRRISHNHPDAVMTDCFLNILWNLEKPAVHWVDVRLKGELITELQRTAICIERSLPRRLRTGDMVTDNWLKDRSEQMASGVRSLIKWLYTPQLNTRAEFTARVASYFTYSARGDWDSFELESPERLSRPELFRTRARLILMAIFSAAVPIALLMLVKRLGAVAEPTLTYLTLGGYVWAVLSLLASIDPNYSTKLTAIKDISTLLPFGKKDKE